MSGPPYPRPPGPGSNGIGRFIIGVSPIGDIPAFEWWNTVISQYANSPVLTQLIANFFECVDQTRNMDEFFDLIWNIDTAQGRGLDIWGEIIGVSRTLTVQTAEFFGFEEQLPGVGTFGQDSFYVGVPATENFDLSDPSYRTLLFAKALSNISDGSVKSINQLLLNLFPNRGNCYVIDGLDMTMIYRFEFELTPVEEAIVSSSGALPKPTGVLATVVQG